MKSVLTSLYILCFLCTVACSNDDDTEATTMEQMEEIPMEEARTQIPDPVFEQYLIDQNFDDEIDGSTLTSRLLNVQQIVVDNLNISDLKGIEDCPELNNLWLQNCNVSNLNVSNNPKLQFIYFDNNSVTSIDVSNLAFLEKLSGRNNGLNSIEVSSNPELELLEISGNEITEIDVSQNTALFRLDVSENPLNCIQANQEQIDDSNLVWTLDEEDTLSLDCN